MGAKEVAAGAEWLDENFPGWEREIDLGTLDIHHCQECILGQALREKAKETGEYSGFDYGQCVAVNGDIGQKATWAWDHGFLRSMDEALWVELIKERFSTGNLSDTKETQ